MQAVNPYLNFPGTTEQAFQFYKTVFGGDFPMVVRFRDVPGNMGVGAQHGDKIAHIALPLGKGNMLMATDSIGQSGRELTTGNNCYLMLECDSAAEAEKLFAGLAAGGKTEMPLQKTEWAEQYGVCADKFGVQWMISYTGSVRFGG